MNLSNIITVNERFESSINLKLDLENNKKVDAYIPTSSSVAILDAFLEDLLYEKKWTSTMLTGAYGKGKSHLLLVLLFLLNRPAATKKKELSLWKKSVRNLQKKVANINENTALKLKELVQKEKKYLPVIINFGRESLEQSYLLALQNALQRDGISELVFDTHFEVANHCIDQWKKEFYTTYQLLEEKLCNSKFTTISILQQALFEHDSKALQLFKEIYPTLTAGSQFHPMISMDTMDIYKDTLHLLQEQYHYEGILIVFDEFSKFIESEHPDEVSTDMKLVQDMCELCNSSHKASLCQIFVTHKSIKEYGRYLAPEVLHAFEGVEGRLHEISFATGYRNYYELIQNVICKENTDINQFAKEQRFDLDAYARDVYPLANFHTIFSYEQFKEIVVYGCFPLAPLTTHLLLQISEAVGQNERTLFTFLSKKEEYTLVSYLHEEKKADAFLISADRIYDYFRDLLLHDKSNPRYQDECRKAEYILKQQTDPNCKKWIKVLALFTMIHSSDMPANDLHLQNACNMPADLYEQCKKELLASGYIVFRKRHKEYAFSRDKSIHLEQEIETLAQNMTKQPAIDSLLYEILEQKYELPKKYNQQKAITRFFEYLFLDAKTFLQLSSPDIFWKQEKGKGYGFSDGKILMLLSDPSVSEKQIRQKLQEWKEERLLVVFPHKTMHWDEKLKQYCVVQELLSNAEEIAKQEFVEEELLLYKDDLLYELNTEIAKTYFPSNKKQMSAMHLCDEQVISDTIQSFTQMHEVLNEICIHYYGQTPRINNEMINRRNITAQTKNARKKIMDAILQDQDVTSWDTGTAQEATIFRAVFTNVGISDLHDKNKVIPKDIQMILTMIMEFVNRAFYEKQSFQALYDRLTGKKIGLRKGIIPIYLSWILARTEGTPVLYAGKAEQELSADTLTEADNTPDNHWLFILSDSKDVMTYLEQIEKLFGISRNLANKKAMRLRCIVRDMQEWYRSLSQYARIVPIPKEDIPQNLNVKMFTKFRDSLKQIEINPREYLFEILPALFEASTLTECIKRLTKAKQFIGKLYDRLLREAEQITRNAINVSHDVSLRPALKDWKEQYDTGEIILSHEAVSLFHYIQNLADDNTENILNHISKCFLGKYLSDYNESGLTHFQEAWDSILTEVTQKETTDQPNQYRFTIRRATGNTIEKTVSTEENNSSTHFLETEMESLLDDYAEELSTEQKIRVLLQMIENTLEQG